MSQSSAAKVVSLFETLPEPAQEFVLFWYRYPKKVAKLDAQRAWARLSRADQRSCLDRLPMIIAHWQLSGTQRRFIPYPATFLNGRRWEDDLQDIDEPITDLGRCDWNRNGTREPGGGQCDSRATLNAPNGNCYCQAHGAKLGLWRRG